MRKQFPLEAESIPHLPHLSHHVRPLSLPLHCHSDVDHSGELVWFTHASDTGAGIWRGLWPTDAVPNRNDAGACAAATPGKPDGKVSDSAF